MLADLRYEASFCSGLKTTAVHGRKLAEYSGMERYA